MPLLNIRAIAAVGAAGTRVTSGRFDLDNSYPAGGYPANVLAAPCGYGSVADVIVDRPVGANLDTTYDIVNQTIRAYVSSTGAEVAPGVDLSGFTSIAFIAFGS